MPKKAFTAQEGIYSRHAILKIM